MITFVTLSGFLGAGKTTTMMRAAAELERAGRQVAVVTNDQGAGLVDTEMARSRLRGVGEVSGGCFCCRFEDLADTTMTLVEDGRADVVIAEAVGSCTDIQATVIRPLRGLYGDQLSVAPLTSLTDPHRYQGFARSWDAGEPESDLSYLFRNQLEEADVIAVNKVDLLRPGEAETVVEAVRRRFPHAQVLPCAAATGDGIAALVERWMTPGTDAGRDLDLDYGRYARAEARLAWLNQRWEVAAAGGATVRPRDWVARTLTALGQRCDAAGLVVGHAKVLLRTTSGATKASLVEAGGDVRFDESEEQPGAGGTAVVNARIDCAPEDLDTMVAAAVAAADAHSGTRSRLLEGSSFTPAEPRPTHRMPAAGS